MSELNERRLAKLEQFADTMLRENIADNKTLINERKMLLEVLQMLDNRSRLESIRLSALRLMVESLIATHPDRDALKIDFQKRTATAQANVADGSFEYGLPVAHMQNMNRQLSEELTSLLALCSSG